MRRRSEPVVDRHWRSLCICSNGEMYLSKLKIAFFQVLKCICICAISWRKLAQSFHNLGRALSKQTFLKLFALVYTSAAAALSWSSSSTWSWLVYLFANSLPKFLVWIRMCWNGAILFSGLSVSDTWWHKSNPGSAYPPFLLLITMMRTTFCR